jgi:hypothetical protein
MEVISIEKSSKSPSINFDAANGNIEIMGRSVIENTKNFYEPLVNGWIDKYLESPNQTTNVNIFLEYYNTSSSMWIFQMLKKLTILPKLNKNLNINWYYSDEDIKEAGEDFQLLLSYKLNLIHKSRH